MIEEVRNKVAELLSTDKSGHGSEHVERVARLAEKFAKQEGADVETAVLIALLHDADDYKLFGAECAENFTNTKRILAECGASQETIDTVIAAMKTIGYSKRLAGLSPETLEGKIVSDADMCDGIGATGILRSFQYNIAHDKLFFDKDISPVLELTSSEYKNKTEGTVVTHMFEKLLTLKDLMLTESGKQEAVARHEIMIDFLRHYFDEVNAPEWTKYLDEYLAKR